MKSNLKALSLAVLIAGIGGVHYATDASQAYENANRTACGIDTETGGNSVMLTGIATGLPGETGQYRLTIRGGGSGGTTSTSQGGAFEIGPDGRAETGRVMLGNDGVYDARFQYQIGSETFDCETRIGDRI
ncbi:curli-like amyloid fiber formation chaperone CsgH [uncultured Roseibium sp.]|uniref:curli-like amyloid fiber formation chaperone CsgH n=1 Tax=uncultured Roseibium sp. TaxID=1936171 RepID=UPI00261787F4|nr:curli-like amyloid fiber formation chaperone CsgH [uncultured Roseibium sp.]